MPSIKLSSRWGAPAASSISQPAHPCPTGLTPIRRHLGSITITLSSSANRRLRNGAATMTTDYVGRTVLDPLSDPSPTGWKGGGDAPSPFHLWAYGVIAADAPVGCSAD